VALEKNPDKFVCWMVDSLHRNACSHPFLLVEWRDMHIQSYWASSCLNPLGHLFVFSLSPLPSRIIDQEIPCKVEILAYHKMFSNSAIAQFTLVPSKNILVTLQNLLELLLLLFIQTNVNHDSLTSLSILCSSHHD